MKIINEMGAQGDVIFQRVDVLPEDTRPTPVADQYIVAHSETGHHHVARSRGARMYETEDPTVSYLELLSPARIEHMRSFDTHETIELLGKIDALLDENADSMEPTYYKVTRQRQATLEGWQRVVD